MHEMFRRQINPIAETHYFLRRELHKTLKKHLLADDIKKVVGNFDTYYEEWQAHFGDRFFDMATMIRLGTVIENCLKYYYMDKAGHSTLVELRADPHYSRGIFQRIQSGKRNGAIDLYQNVVGYDIALNPYIKSIQEAMQHRHLYAHNSGLIDDEYINNLRNITGQDITTHPMVAQAYPQQDVYWFEPLGRLNFFIEETRNFFSRFP